MSVHLSLGVTTLVAMMEAERSVASGLAPKADTAGIDAWLQPDMLLDETQAGRVLCNSLHHPK